MTTNRNAIAFALAALILPLSLKAATEVVDGITWTYTVSYDYASIYKSSSSSAIPSSTTGAITIPSTLGGYRVSSIGKGAFYHCSGLTSVTIPDSVTSIGDYAFEGCTGLTSVTIPNSVTSIGRNAFDDCNSLESLAIPDSVTSIGKYAFNGCIFATFRIPEGLVHIGDHVFYGCTNLVTVTFHDNLASIGEYAFDRCSSLESVAIPDSVTKIGICAFLDCNNLASVILPAKLGSIATNTFCRCSKLVSISIPDSVTNIQDWAFYECRGLALVAIPDSVTSIGKGAFYGCSGLTSVTIGKGVTSIGNSAFEGCSGLASVHIFDLAAWCRINFASSFANPLCHTNHLFLSGKKLTELIIPDSVTSIGRYAFYNCTSLTSVTIPNSVTSIGDSAFNGCSGLKSVNISQYVCTNGLWSVFESAYQSITNVVIQDGVTSIRCSETLANLGYGTFSGCYGLISVTIPHSITTIGRNAFIGCHRLASVTIPDSVTSIEDSAFRYCESLSSITIPDSVTSIEAQAFKGCTGLTSVTIPNTVTRMEASVFALCGMIREVTAPGRFAMSSVFPNAYGAIEKFSFAEGTDAIANGAFADCSSLASITIPQSVRTIGASAFLNCYNLTSITIPDSVLSIGDHAFSGCAGITRFSIGKDTSYIGPAAFRGCYSLMAFEVSSLNQNFKCQDGAIFSKDGKSLVAYPPGVVGIYAVPNGTFSVAECAFAGCYGIKAILIPNSVTAVGNLAFTGCDDLADVYMPIRFKDRRAAFFDDDDSLKRCTFHYGEYPTSIISLDPSGGMGGSAEATAAYGSALPPINVPTRSGYDFGGYYTAADGRGTQYYNAAGQGVRDWDIASSATTLYAKWTAKTKAKTFGSGKTSTFEVPGNGTATLVGVSGATWGDFAGRDSYGTTAFVNANIIDAEKTAKDDADDYWCYAMSDMDALYYTGWAKKTKFATVDDMKDSFNASSLRGGTLDGVSEGKYGMLAKYGGWGGLFAWYKDATGIDLAAKKALTEGCVDASFLSTLRRLMDDGGHVVRINVYFADVLFNEKWKGFSVSHGVLCVGYVADGNTLNGLFIVDPDNDMYTGAGGRTAPNSIMYCPVLWENSLEYSISGVWGQVGVIKPEFRALAAMPSSEMAKPPYTATFDANGGTGGASVTLAYGSALSAPAVSLTGYTFAGWLPAVPATMPVGGVVCVAQWKATTYTVKFNANGGKLPKGKKMAAQTMTYGKAAALRKNVFTRSGYVFLGWATKKGGAVAYKNGQSVKNLRTDGKTTALYAVWAKKTYKVAFYANGGTGKMAAESFTYGKAKKLTANKFKAPKGKKFAGWATSAANAKKGVVKFKNKAAVKNLVVTGKTVKLYAVWKKKK